MHWELNYVVSRRSGFTLIEIVIVVFILLLILGLAVPSLSGVFADKRLHRSLDHFNSLVQQAHERSLAERRPYLIVWTDNEVQLQPATFLKGEEHKPIGVVSISRNDKWGLDLPAAISGKLPMEWIFWESGVCEPARVSFTGSDGAWTAQYSPLTTLAEILSYAPR